MSARSRGSVPFCRRCCYCDSGTAAVEGTGRVMPGWKCCTGNEEAGGGVSSFPTLSSSSPGAIKMRFPDLREGDAAVPRCAPRGGGKGQKKFCVAPLSPGAGHGWGCGVHAASFRAWENEAPPARGATFFGEKKKMGCCAAGACWMRGVPRAAPSRDGEVCGEHTPGQFSLLVFFLLLLFLLSVHYTASRPLPGCLQLAGNQ